ncbi:MAG: phosphonate C-P lyase system protein PhnH, partial [Dehalococcoidia bacterium]|nr:phosphonate C-P lyase system protein PhnH [Dehalococcoidia bacterium]
IEAAHEGPLEEPERSATVVVLCDAVGEGDLVLTLSGPGVDGETTLRVGGLDAAVVKARAERNWPFPTGIDLVLVDPRGRLASLPRSTTATIAAPQEVS